MEDYTLFQLTYAGTFSNGFAEISAPNAVFDGTGTATTLYVESSSADDDSGAADHVQKVTIIGLDANGFTTEEVTMNGTTAVETSTSWVRVFHMYASAWGTGGDDAAGDITLGDDSGPTTTYLTIGNGSNESDGAALFLPSGKYWSTYHEDLVMTTSANANASILTKVGWINCNSNGADPDLDYNIYRQNLSANNNHQQLTRIHRTQASAKITFYETYKGAAEDGFFQIGVVVW